MKNNNLHYWLEAEQPAGNQAPASDPNAPGQGGQIPPQQPPQQPDPGTDPSAAAQDDVTQDPQHPDELPQESQGYEQWKHDFMEAAIKSDNEVLVTMLKSVRDRELDVAQKRFVEDNMQIFLFRRDASITKASKEVRALIKQDLDKTNPGSTVMQHFMATLDANPLLYQGLIKLGGTFAWKGDLHRKWIAAILGAVQVGGGSTTKDLVIPEKEFDINFSTRFTTQFGEINIGKWSLIESDPKTHLKPDELSELQEGSPDKKQVLRREIIMKSIGETYRKRAFLINVVTTDGTVYALGWDLGNSILDAYKQGKVVVRGNNNEDKEIMIGDDGNIIPVIDYSLMFVKETGEIGDDGQPETNEVPFMERKDSTLYLVADLETIRLAASSMSGMFFHQVPYGGNPAEVQQLQRAIPGLTEIMVREVV
jgi:hypothetical protein